VETREAGVTSGVVTLRQSLIRLTLLRLTVGGCLLAAAAMPASLVAVDDDSAGEGTGDVATLIAIPLPRDGVAREQRMEVEAAIAASARAGPPVPP
jgi:hypothetical protein